MFEILEHLPRNKTFSPIYSQIKYWFWGLKVRMANREDPDQQSCLSLHCLSRPSWQVASFSNFRTITEKEFMKDYALNHILIHWGGILSYTMPITLAILFGNPL